MKAMNTNTKPDEPPEMNEFFLRGIPLEEAVEARRRWPLLSLEEKQALGFCSEYGRVQ
jgi:hypothetical protein